MKLPFGKEEETPVDVQIEFILNEMTLLGPDDEKYPNMLSLLERLYKLKAEKCRPPVSRDTIALIAGNLLGILLIVIYEEKHVLTSKGMNQLIKPR